jgi:hypothetical protein
MRDETENEAADDSAPRVSFGALRIGCLVAVVIAVALAITNPTDAEVRKKIVADGWVPVRAERTDLWLLSYTNIVGFTGAKATYVGIGGNVFGVERGK